jgi:SMP-30/Gluconolactonase/LRE-like region
MAQTPSEAVPGLRCVPMPWTLSNRGCRRVAAPAVIVLAMFSGVAAAGAPHRRGIPSPQSATRAVPACRPWRVRTLLSGQGWLENLAFDGRGAITISALTQGRILRLSRSGHLSTLLASVPAPGGERTIGRYLFFNTGDTVPVKPNGTIERLDLKTGRHTTWARGLTMPNGLAFLPDGDAVVSRDLGTGTGITRVAADDRRHPQTEWARLDDTNGLAVDASGRWLYTDRTLSPDGEVDRISVANPRRVQAVGRLGAGAAPDDLTLDELGNLFIAGFGSGKIYRVDIRRHLSCVIATGLSQPTSVRFGGAGWPANRLYVTDAAGHLSELTPPRS